MFKHTARTIIMNDLRTLLLDIVKHTGGLGFIDVVKISTTDDGFTKVEAMDEEKSVIVSGTLKETEERFIGTFGMSRLSVLKGFADFANYKADDATIEIKTRDRNGALAAEEIVDLLETDLSPYCRTILELRQLGSKTSTTKIAKMIACTAEDGRFRGAFQYSGASTTRRWAGEPGVGDLP